MSEHQLTTPVGRLVAGSLYIGNTTDYDGNPLKYKTGAKMGQDRVEYSFGVAFPKTPGGGHWANEAWLAPVWALAHASFPQGEAQRRDFSFKIIDGDSTEPNKKMRRPCDSEGYPGHWVIFFSGSQPPRVCNSDGSALITQPGAVKKGFFVQVLGSVTKNTGATPGLYWNHSAVAYAAWGQEISSGPDMTQAKFGQGVVLPVGASAVPQGGAMPGSPPPPPGVPAAAAPAPAPLIPGMAPGPNSSYVSPPAPGGLTPPSAVGAKAMSSKATSAGLTYESFQVGTPGSQWTDALLVQEGYMLPPAVVAPPVPLAPGGSAPPPPVGAPIAVVPNPAFTQIMPPAVAAGPTLTPKAAATGMTYAQLLAMPGWSDVLLRQEGYIL